VIIVIADTSVLLAALDSTHPEHRAANKAILAAGLLVMSPLLLAELDHVATRELGREAVLSAVDDIRHWMRRGRVVVPEITEDHLGAAQSIWSSSRWRSWPPSGPPARSDRDQRADRRRGLSGAVRG
jgi:predicted nucleic acid-binding protein